MIITPAPQRVQIKKYSIEKLRKRLLTLRNFFKTT